MLSECERFIKAARKDGMEAEVYWMRSSEGLIELEGARIPNASTGISNGVGIRVMKGGTVRFLHSTEVGRPGTLLRRCAEVPGPSAHFRFPPQPGKLPDVQGLYDPRVSDITMERAVESASAMQEAVSRVSKKLTIGSGSISWSSTRVALCNTEGLEVEYTTSFMAVSMYCVYTEGRKSSASSHILSRSLIEEPEMCAREAAELAVESSRIAEARGIEEVVFTPEAAAEVLGSTLVPAVIGQRVEDGSSVLAGKLNEHIGGDVTVTDSGLIPGGMGSSPVDDEGVPSSENTLIERGVFRMALYDLNTAGKYRRDATSSGVRSGYDDPPSSAPRNLVLSAQHMEAGDPVAEVDRGIVVHDVYGAHTANPTTSEFTVNTGTAFVVENGEIKGALRTGIIMGDLFRLLGGVHVLGKDRKWVLPGPFLMPHVVVRGLKTFT